MNFLIFKEKKSNQPLFLVIFVLMAVFLFTLTSKSVFADNFFVVTQLPTQLDERMSVLSGFVSNDISDSANIWFEYGKNGKFEKSSSKENIMGARDLTSRIYSLESGVVYSYRIAGRKENSNVIKYGETKTFIIASKGSGSSGFLDNNLTQQTNTSQTSGQINGECVTCCNCPQTTSSVKPGIPSIKNPLTTNTTATLSSTLLTGGTPTRGWFEWGTTESLGRVTPAKKLGSASSVEMKETVFGLLPGTKYYYRSVAVTEEGVSKSAITSFTTQGQKSGGVGVNTDDSLGNSENTYNQTTKDAIDKNLTDNDSSENKVSDKEQDSDEDPLGGVFAWGNTLRGQFFTIDEKGNIDTGISFGETKKENQNFLLAGTLYGKKFLPDTWSEWGFITIFLYFIISRLHYFFRARKKRKDEKKEREEEMRKTHDLQFEQTANSGGVIA